MNNLIYVIGNVVPSWFNCEEGNYFDCCIDTAEDYKPHCLLCSCEEDPGYCDSRLGYWGVENEDGI